MTERSAAAVARAPDRFVVGPSEMSWRDGALVIDIDERAAPLPYPTRGRIVVRPEILTGRTLPLDAAARHMWTPIAPRCDVSVEFTAPALRWRGAGYLDANAGDEPLEAGFRSWTWSRSHDEKGCVVLYNGAPRQGGALNLALHVGPDGAITHRELPPAHALPTTLWQLSRETHADRAGVRRTLEDAPFYSRSELYTTLYGHTGPAMHECLDLDRFASTWVRTLLPVRMPRRRI
jgi:carotenoid 1,2-hydratase